MSSPVVSVIMSVYNGEQYLKIALESILKQTYPYFEFIIINDCSTDESKTIIQSYGDDRIIYVENEQNIGLAASLNKGIHLAKGEFIARMDDDDIAYPERLQKQVNYLNNHPKIGLLGTYARLVGNTTGLRKHAEDSDELKVKTFFSCQFCHPTVMIRKCVLDENNLYYNEFFFTAQDYELWSRMLKYTDFGTIPEVLLDYRTHEKQISHSKRDKQIKATQDIYKSMQSSLGFKEYDLDINIYEKLARLNFKQKEKDLSNIANFLQSVIQANNSKKVFPEKKFASFMSEYFYNILNTSTKKSLNRINLYTSFKKYYSPKFGLLKQIIK